MTAQSKNERVKPVIASRKPEKRKGDQSVRHSRDKKGRVMPKRGAPKVTLTDKQKNLAYNYVSQTGYWPTRLAAYLGIDAKTLHRILKEDKYFSAGIELAEAKFCGKKIKKASPDFILKTKYREEFPEKVQVEHGMDEELKKFFDRQKRRLP